MLLAVILLIVILVILYLLVRKPSSVKPSVQLPKRIPACVLYKNIIVPAGLDWSTEIVEDFRSGILEKEVDVISDGQLLSQIADADKNNLPIVWVYNPYEVSSKFWLNFMSRKHRQTTSDLRRLCLTTILKYFPEYHYRVVVFNQENVKALIPECRSFSSDYLYDEYIKYSLLEKYGGYWIPIDTVMVQSITDKTTSDYFQNKLIVMGYESSQYNDIFGFHSNYIACKKNHIIMKEMMRFIIHSMKTFQNAIRFKDGVNKYFQHLCNKHQDSISKQDLLAYKNRHNRMLSFEDLYSDNNNMPPLSTIYIVPTLYDIVNKKHMWRFIERLSSDQIMDSEMWMGYAIKTALDK